MARRDFGGLERRRMRAVRLFERGETQSVVARRLDVSRTTAMRWAQAWEQDGREGLRAAGRAGRKPRLSEEQLRGRNRKLFVAVESPPLRSYRSTSIPHFTSGWGEFFLSVITGECDCR